MRDGTYGTRTSRPRQRYRCTPSDGSRPHRFTPALPRDHVHPDEEGCASCGELRGFHHGDRAVARRHSWPVSVVARTLADLARGASYADASLRALRAADLDASRRPAHASQGEPGEDGREPERYRRTRRPKPEAAAAPAGADQPAMPVTVRRPSAASRAAASAWHIAADWVAAFGPVVFAPVEAGLRERALAERTRLDELRAAGQPVERPQVLVLDDVPVYGRDQRTGKARRDDGFYLLAAAEVIWGPPPQTPFEFPAASLRLRAVRAMPKSNAACWRQVFAELGYEPDFVVADAGTGIARAIGEHFDPSRTVFVPSLWHTARAIENALAQTRGALVSLPGGGKEPLPELRDHLKALRRDRAIASVEAWRAWWDDLERICRDLHLPLDRIRVRRRNYERPYVTAIAALTGLPEVPVSSGGLETLLAKRVQPLLARRRTSFANIERTNALFDLVVADEHGAFDDPGAVQRLLADDALAHDGWAVPLRDCADPKPENGRYSSLRDTLLATERAEKAGLA
ncbi:hypothetical protein Q6346_03315 [Isoptericola sp. b490]|uniref:hypothetical protein n=1 Tax=Actinotalea lenta TaxID=3064654 RepID=UPI0027124125|nr:hypothetical protein [Isoptericola sp. b490]MDO8120340.1 hypothetical protein [Isoptericola sp. b490]